FLPGSNLLDTGDGAGNELIKPTPATRDRCDECRAGFGTNRSKVMWRPRDRHNDLAPSLHRRLPPWDAQNRSIVVDRVAKAAGCFLRLELNRQLVRLQLDPHDMIADKLSVITFCGLHEMLAHSGCDARLDFGRRHPRHGARTLGLPMEQRR